MTDKEMLTKLNEFLEFSIYLECHESRHEAYNEVMNGIDEVIFELKNRIKNKKSLTVKE